MWLKMYLTCKVANKFLNVCERERAVKRNKDDPFFLLQPCESPVSVKENRDTKKYNAANPKHLHNSRKKYKHARTHTHTHTHTSRALNRSTYSRAQINDFIWTIEHITCFCNAITTDFFSCYHERGIFVI